MGRAGLQCWHGVSGVIRPPPCSILFPTLSGRMRCAQCCPPPADAASTIAVVPKPSSCGNDNLSAAAATIDACGLLELREFAFSSPSVTLITAPNPPSQTMSQTQLEHQLTQQLAALNPRTSSPQAPSSTSASSAPLLHKSSSSGTCLSSSDNSSGGSAPSMTHSPPLPASAHQKCALHAAFPLAEGALLLPYLLGRISISGSP